MAPVSSQKTESIVGRYLKMTAEREQLSWVEQLVGARPYRWT